MSKRIYIVTELCQKGDLHKYKKENNLSKKDIIALFSGILKGIIAIHDCDIVHGDLKPHNVLLSDSLQPKICDLGLSNFITASMTSI